MKLLIMSYMYFPKYKTYEHGFPDVLYGYETHSYSPLTVQFVL